jgi:alpha-L-rhamnosidase
MWSASMVAAPRGIVGAPLLRGEVLLDQGHGKVDSALLHVSAHGVVETVVNGAATGDLLTPGWSSYASRLRYLTSDVTPLVGAHTVVGLSLGNGWWRGALTWWKSTNVYGARLAAIAQLEVRFADGHVQVWGTDATWLARGSETLRDDLYDGQTIDARLRDDTWQQPAADVSDWLPVEVVDLDTSLLTPYLAPPVRRQDVLATQRVWTSSGGRTLVDFGQNLVGFTRIRVQGEAGREIVVRHAEVLEDGELGVRPLRRAEATDRFVLSGGTDVFEPTKTFHGFRYAEVTGWPGELGVSDIDAVLVHSDLRRTGEFACSDPLLERLHSNVVWGFRGNAVDLPTDCPQRDERLGWTGDIAVFAPTACFLYDVEGFLRDWLLDLAADQRANGDVVPYVVPDALRTIADRQPAQGRDIVPVPLRATTAVWGDAAVWVPWALYEAYGAGEILTSQLDSMLTHVRAAAALRSPTGLWDEGFQYGDWLDPTAPPDAPLQARCHKGVVATAALFRSATFTAGAAEILGRAAEAAEMATLAAQVRAAFVDHYVEADGTVFSDAETGYALAIAFGLLDEPLRSLAGDRLRALVAAAGHRVTTGFAGTPYVLDALASTGHLDDAYALLMQQECPSWLYQVRMGATTVWERWDSMLPDGSINDGEMTSFNHYAFGAVADWLHRTVGGLAPLEPGYRRVLVAPRPGGGLTWARTAFTSRHGRIEVSWRVERDDLVVEVELPDGVTGVLRLDGRPELPLASGRSVHRGVPASA